MLILVCKTNRPCVEKKSTHFLYYFHTYTLIVFLDACIYMCRIVLVLKEHALSFHFHFHKHHFPTMFLFWEAVVKSIPSEGSGYKEPFCKAQFPFAGT